MESKKDWWSSKNTYLKTSDRLAQEVLMTVGRGIVNDHLACGKKVPDEWLNEKSDFQAQMAFYLSDGPRDVTLLRWKFANYNCKYITFPIIFLRPIQVNQRRIQRLGDS